MYRRKTLTGSPDPTHATGRIKPLHSTMEIPNKHDESLIMIALLPLDSLESPQLSTTHLSETLYQEISFHINVSVGRNEKKD